MLFSIFIILILIYFTTVNLRKDIKPFEIKTASQQTLCNYTIQTEQIFEEINSKPQYPQYEEYSVPKGDTSFKAFMYSNSITDTSSEQYLIQKKSIPDSQGIMRYQNYMLVAMGSYYGKLYDRFEIELETGKKIYVMIADIKNDIHTDNTNRFNPMSNERKCVLEFIVDADKIDSKVQIMGDVSYIGYEGDIVKIKKIIGDVHAG